MPEAHVASVAELLVALDAESAEPLPRQVYQGIEVRRLGRSPAVGRLNKGIRPSSQQYFWRVEVA